MTIRKIGEYVGPDGRVVLRRWRIEEKGATVSEPLSEEELAAIRQRQRAASTVDDWQGMPAYVARLETVAQVDMPALLAEVDRLCMKLSQCSESFDKLSTQYHEARERWQQMMDRERAQVAAMRPIVEAVAFASVRPTPAYRGDIHIEIEILNTIYEQARALPAKEGDT
jgi:hypothetical protein